MKHLVFDTETTDLIANSARSLDKQPYIFEICGVVWDDADDSETLHHWQLDPGAPISKSASKKTGVHDAMVKGRPLFRSVAPAIREMIEKSDCVVAHNLSFDRMMVKLEFSRLAEMITFPARGVCTLESTEHLQGYRLSLSNLHRLLFNEDFEKAHSADADVRATLRCYRELLKRGEI